MRQNKTQNKWLWIALAGTLVSVVGLSDALFRERGKRSVAEQKLQSMTVPADPSKPGPSVERSAETPPGTASAVNATSGTERRANPPLSTEYIQVIEETRAALEGDRRDWQVRFVLTPEGPQRGLEGGWDASASQAFAAALADLPELKDLAFGLGAHQSQ